MHYIEPQNADKIRDWLKTRNGVAVWTVKDLSSPKLGNETFTPATNPQGEPSFPPHWSFGNKPDKIITDSTEFMVRTYKEVSRVKVRRGPAYAGELIKPIELNSILPWIRQEKMLLIR